MTSNDNSHCNNKKRWLSLQWQIKVLITAMTNKGVNHCNDKKMW